MCLEATLNRTKKFLDAFHTQKTQSFAINVTGKRMNIFQSQILLLAVHHFLLLLITAQKIATRGTPKAYTKRTLFQ
jgi:hypothetical protein